MCISKGLGAGEATHTAHMVLVDSRLCVYEGPVQRCVLAKARVRLAYKGSRLAHTVDTVFTESIQQALRAPGRRDRKATARWGPTGFTVGATNQK